MKSEPSACSCSWREPVRHLGADHADERAHRSHVRAHGAHLGAHGPDERADCPDG
ncbi:hypothetical protein [Dermacoccus barathri]|uniref:hypothetical protein n=1 Tax=Dermacoccus barathri TaxID=322601 RepID=UPI001D0D7596|nr:hypothetical protein [Dermacoccus barathri]